ncbi:cytochrome P450 [Geodermatophilus sabuli]|uniref:Cytochrome P450 n=1 Tax=Geodermatophilus sabuli TaxID=1564158 RepID=A0A7K3VX80_9ACTN|nr:cytochrome P450 [Geodermatophilus sabuli]NEK56958.1 cytochrome P450 [Geodermatophilus sabuli]
MTALSPLVELDPDAVRDPAGVYEQLRERGVHHAPEIDAFVVARHDDVVRVLRDGRTFSSRNTVGRVLPPADPSNPRPPLSPLLLLSDDPEHAQRRSIVNRAFTPSKIAAWEPQIRQVAEEHVDRLGDLGEVDLVRDLAALLPIRVVSLVLGVPLRDVTRFREWSEEITASVGNHGGDPVRREQVQDAFSSYISLLLDQWDGTVDARVLSQIAAAERAGELTRTQCVSFVAELLVAGNITTTHHIASSIALLGSTPGLLDRLRSDPRLVQPFVEESLRLEAPIQGFYRLAMADAEIGGVPIPEGSRVFVLYGSANRDPQVWEDCPHLRLDRPNAAAHLAFGKGAHACIGSSLARLEGRVVVEVLLDRLETLELLAVPADLPYLASFVNHGPVSLPARVRLRGSVPAQEVGS